MIVEQNNDTIVKQQVNVDIEDNHTVSIVYGSLREGCYNHDSFKRAYGEGYKKMSNAWITGFKLYSLGAYPCVVFTGDEEDKLLVDVFQCNQACHNSIYRMEIGAGYYAKTIELLADNGNAYQGIIYCYEENYGYTQVTTGDWVTFINEKNASRYNNQ